MGHGAIAWTMLSVLVLSAPAAAQASAREPALAVLPPAAKSSQKKQAAALHKALTASVAAPERAPKLVDARSSPKETTRQIQRNAKRRHKAYQQVVERTKATHLLDLTLVGTGKRTKLKAELIGGSTFDVLATAEVEVGKAEGGPFIAEIVKALGPQLPRSSPPAPPAPLVDEVSRPVVTAPAQVAAAREGSPAPGGVDAEPLAAPATTGAPADDEGGSVMPWVFYGSSALTGLITVGALGAGAVLGVLAYVDSLAYVQSAPNAYGRAELRTQSELKAVGADALYVGAAVAGLVTLGLVVGGTTFLFLE